MEHELFTTDSFERAKLEAQRLAKVYSVEVGVRRKGQGWAVIGPLDLEDPEEWRYRLKLAEVIEAARAFTIEQQDAEAAELLEQSPEVILENRYPNGELDAIDPEDASGRTYREVLREMRFDDQCEPDPAWRDL